MSHSFRRHVSGQRRRKGCRIDANHILDHLNDCGQLFGKGCELQELVVSDAACGVELLFQHQETCAMLEAGLLVGPWIYQKSLMSMDPPSPFKIVTKRFCARYWPDPRFEQPRRRLQGPNSDCSTCTSLASWRHAPQVMLYQGRPTLRLGTIRLTLEWRELANANTLVNDLLKTRLGGVAGKGSSRI